MFTILTEFTEMKLKSLEKKTVNSTESKCVMVDIVKNLPLPKTQVKAILLNPVEDNKGRELVYLFSGGVNMKKMFLILILQSLNQKCI